jgi:hypothetical protein
MPPGDTDDLSPEQQRVIEAAKGLTHFGEFIYNRPRGDDTPIPACAGCGESNWNPDRIVHRPDCRVTELIAAVRALKG